MYCIAYIDKMMVASWKYPQNMDIFPCQIYPVKLSNVLTQEEYD